MYRLPVTSLTQEGVAVNLMGVPGAFQWAVQIACSVSGCAVDDPYDLEPCPSRNGWRFLRFQEGRLVPGECRGDRSSWTLDLEMLGHPRRVSACWHLALLVLVGCNCPSCWTFTEHWERDNSRVEHGLKGSSAWAILGAAAFSSMLVVFGRLSPRT